MITFAEFQATKKTIIGETNILEELSKRGVEMDSIGGLTALHIYDAGEQGDGYIEQYGEFINVTLESEQVFGTLAECEQALYIYLAPMEE